MARPNRSAERRAELLPVLARTFAEHGYRKTTTALLARATGLQEPALYRLWPDKRAMFLAALDHVHARSVRRWSELESAAGSASAAERILDYEGEHHGEEGLYRLVFAGLSEVDDPEIASGLARLYRRFHAFARRSIEAHRDGAGAGSAPDPALAAWALLGLGTLSNVGRELGLISGPARKRLFDEVGRHLLGGPVRRRARRK